MTSGHITCRIAKMIMVGVFLFGCAEPTTMPSPDQIDKSPFTGIPCAAPCWHGLMIGKSSESDVISTISTLTFIDQKSVYYHRMPSMDTLDPDVFGEGVEITANCAKSEKQCLTVQVVENFLTEISIKLNYQIKVSEAIEYLGNPNYVGFDRAGGELVACRVYLIWSEKQLVLASEIFEGPSSVEGNCYVVRGAGKISSSLLVLETRYMSVAAIEKLLSNSGNEFFRFSGMSPEQ